MSELIALVDTDTDLVTGQAKPESFPGGIVFGLRREGDRPLDLPGFAPQGQVQEVLLPLPGEQPDRVMEYFDIVHVRADKEKAPVWDCKRFAGFVALGTELRVSVLHVATDTYDIAPTPADDLALGLPYEAFRQGVAVHTTIGLGKGLSIGVPGSFNNIRIDNNTELAAGYLADEYWGVRTREFKVSEILLALARSLGAKTVQEAEKIILLEELELTRAERASGLVRSQHTERLRGVREEKSAIPAGYLALLQSPAPDNSINYILPKRKVVDSGVVHIAKKLKNWPLELYISYPN